MNLAVLLLLASPPLPAEVLASPFGVVCPWPEVGAGGMGAVWVRCGAGATELGNWPGNEPFPGTFRFDRAESEWTGFYQKEQLVPTPILGYTPRWASRSPESADAHAYPPDPWAMLRYAEAVSRQFAGRVWYWEVWNEPNIEFFRGDIATYADLVKAAAAGVRRGNPAARVVLGGVAGVDRPFLDRCYQHGVRDFVDVVACHPYQWGNQFNDGWFFDKLTGLRTLLKGWGDGDRPVWLNELGWSSGGVTEEEQARLLVQAFVSGIARRDLGIQRMFWFCVKDWGHPDYGLYADDSHKKPAWHGYRNMVRQLAGRPCAGRLKTDASVRAYAFGEGDSCVVVVWSADLAEHAVTLPIAAAPTAACDLLGQPLTLAAPAAGRLPLTARPAPSYLTVPRAALSDLAPLTALAIAEGDPARHPLVWTSVYPQPGTDLPWL
ncbi:MAG: hypothetical protein HYU66_20365, partial [Armatimonadetes bacterium]|nr:hypothetical protein [Armatimonadota bacterium]